MSDHRMPEDIRKRALHKLPFLRSSTYEFTPEWYKTRLLGEDGSETDEYEIPVEYQPIFILRPLSVSDKQKITEKTDTIEELVRSNVIGFRRMYNTSDGQEMIFEKDPNSDGMAKDQFQYMANTTIIEIVNMLMKLSGLSSADRSGL